jgi:multidrug efflux pump subunit AcrB
MPRGAVPPFIIRYDAGSVPVGALVFSSETQDENELQELAREFVRPLLTTLPGLSAPPPIGGGERTIIIHLDPERLRAVNMSADEVVEALGKTNIVSPSGVARIGSMMPTVAVNSVVYGVHELEDVPVRAGATPAVCIRDVAEVSDNAPPASGYALVDGRRAVFMPVVKRADASTLDVVEEVKKNLPRFQSVLPEDVKVTYDFDQSYYVKRSIQTLTSEGILGALLTGLTALLFLRDWRSALVVVITIPLSLLAAITTLWATGQTINLMTLGGLALAVGILVDMATVVIENIHTHLARGKPTARAVLDGTRETLVPMALAMMCILAVFIPSFFMKGATRSLFVPLALSVGFAMIASYLLAITFVPILTTRLLSGRSHVPHDQSTSSRFSFANFQFRYGQFLAVLLRNRGRVTLGYLTIAIAAIGGLGILLGTEIFPESREGQFQIRFRTTLGARVEETEKTALRLLGLIKREAGEGNVETSLGYVGTHPTSHPVSAIYMWMTGSEEGLLQVQLRKGSGLEVADLRERIRKSVHREMPELNFTFEPSDIVSRVMSFGASTPVQVTIMGKDIRKSRAIAERLREEMSKVPTLRDVRIEQRPDYPTLDVDISRERAGALGLTAKDISDAMIPATSSSRYVARNFWADPRSGLSYMVQVEYPEQTLNSVEEVKNIPVMRNGKKPLLLRNVATVSEGTTTGQYDRYNTQRMMTVTANIVGEDLGRTSRRLSALIAALGEPPRGMKVFIGGQVATMDQMFGSLQTGLLVTIAAIFLLLAANFQSWKLAFVVTSTVPAVLAGVVVILWVTDTTLNIQSFMGGIMSVGVAVANAILLINFAERFRRDGMTSDQAAVEGARSRLRPILMTSIAMMAGMIPMALGSGEGGEQSAPLGRAVIGGLAASTVATLLFLPAVFALVQSKTPRISSSLDPEDPASSNFAGPREVKA